jgi:predicted ATPase
MRITLKNIGPIAEFALDTEKEMHFLFGKNNIGKSYAITVIYLLLKHLHEPVSYYPVISELYESFETVVTNRLTANKVSITSDISIQSEVQNFLEKTFNELFLPKLQVSLGNTFGDLKQLKNEFSQKKAEFILLTEQGNTLTLEVQAGKLILKNFVLKTDYIIQQAVTEQPPSFHSEFFKTILYRKQDSSKINGLPRIAPDFFEKNLNVVHNIYFLPASRSGLYNALNAFGAIFAELARHRTVLRQNIQLPTLGEQLSDYFLYLSTIQPNQKPKDDFSDIAAQIEQKVLKGEIRFDDFSKKIYYQPHHKKIQLELSNASSMIAEVAPLATFLKYIISVDSQAYRKNILFIEEPEAHLHPEMQVALIEIFADLARKGLKLVITSHSNYLFNKLSNLILAQIISPAHIEISYMRLGTEGSFVDKQAMNVDDAGIDDDNFADIAEALYVERMNLSDKYNQNVGSKDIR